MDVELFSRVCGNDRSGEGLISTYEPILAGCPKNRDDGTHFFRALAGFGGISCLFFGTIHLPLAVATLLNWSSILFVILFSGIFLKEHLSAKSLAWVTVSVFGLLLLVLPGLALESGTGLSLSMHAIGVGLLGAIFSPELIIFC